MISLDFVEDSLGIGAHTPLCLHCVFQGPKNHFVIFVHIKPTQVDFRRFVVKMRHHLSHIDD